jgi:hypothetical protein
MSGSLSKNSFGEPPANRPMFPAKPERPRSSMYFISED